MYAVIKSGGKQYKVHKGDTLKLEKLDIAVGEQLSIDEVLMVVAGEQVTIGKPLVKAAKVTAVVNNHGRHAKLKIVKFNRRKHYRKQLGHRQDYTEVAITDINQGEN